jgi:hypothetical protein
VGRVRLTARVTSWLAESSGRRYVLVEPICRLLGVPVAAQLRRIRRHPYIEALWIERAGAHQVAIPVPYLSWLLVTLRPRQDEARARLTRYRPRLIEIAAGQPPRRNGARGPAARRLSRFSPQDVERMHQLKDGMVSLGAIASRHGCRKSTVCDFLSGRRKPRLG